MRHGSHFRRAPPTSRLFMYGGAQRRRAVGTLQPTLDDGEEPVLPGSCGRRPAPGTGGRAGRIGSLVLAIPDSGRKLVYAGNVGTGFTRGMLADLEAKLTPLQRDTAYAFCGASIRGVVWVEPCCVGEVAFTEWTREAILRHLLARCATSIPGASRHGPADHQPAPGDRDVCATEQPVRSMLARLAATLADMTSVRERRRCTTIPTDKRRAAGSIHRGRSCPSKG
ncbi:hypothetical protein [Nocardia sp. CA-135398]|uniref:ATP dependent DNA ligase n=1 Tax=Nocardia sp. CA-135398 TaxID=3239977 RepID=UPI003D970739